MWLNVCFVVIIKYFVVTDQENASLKQRAAELLEVLNKKDAIVIHLLIDVGKVLDKAMLLLRQSGIHVSFEDWNKMNEILAKIKTSTSSTTLGANPTMLNNANNYNSSIQNNNAFYIISPPPVQNISATLPVFFLPPPRPMPSIAATSPVIFSPSLPPDNLLGQSQLYVKKSGPTQPLGPTMMPDSSHTTLKSLKVLGFDFWFNLV